MHWSVVGQLSVWTNGRPSPLTRRHHLIFQRSHPCISPACWSAGDIWCQEGGASFGLLDRGRRSPAQTQCTRTHTLRVRFNIMHRLGNLVSLYIRLKLYSFFGVSIKRTLSGIIRLTVRSQITTRYCKRFFKKKKDYLEREMGLSLSLLFFVTRLAEIERDRFTGNKIMAQ